MSKYQIMPFPEREWKDIEKQLKHGSCSSVRSCNQLDIYKVGDMYLTPWGDKIIIEKVTRYLKAEDIPTWNLMDKGMKISVRMGERYGNNEWDHVVFKKTEK